ncbi:uncharacterized protein LOC141717138 isoform X1 [Apium graveolens]|uniref:uncharacterized protein LOC141717138 isoform X1 n=1 Tax=Apium graveolens TaxID=4045 RepID=UPI003D7991F7
MDEKMKHIEMKKTGLNKTILSLLSEWRDLNALLDTQMICNEKCKNPMNDKLKEIDLNDGPCEDLGEAEGKRVKKMVGREEALREIEGKMREVEFNKRFIEERAKELEGRQKEIDDAYKDLEVKRLIVAEKSRKVDERAKELALREKKLRGKKIDDGYKELEVKMREVAEKSEKADGRAKELELREKEIDEWYKDLEVKKMEVAEKSEKVDAKLVELEEQNLKLNERWEKLNSSEKEVERLQVLCEQRCEEIVGKMREVDSSRKLLEDYSKGLELKQKELENGFKEMESKKLELSQMTNQLPAINFSNADTSMNQTKRKRSSYNLRCRTPARTECPAPQVHQTVTNTNSDGSEEFWTHCTSCKYKFKYQKNLLNILIKCSRCSECYIAYELNAESIPPESKILKHVKFSANTDKFAGMNSSHADVNMNQITTKGNTCADGSNARAANFINNSESNQNQGLLPSPIVVDCPDPEFSDFDKDKNEKCFCVDQFWACYESHDVMPILYAHIRKVFSPNFKLQVTYLKASPDEQRTINWVKAGLPMVCGKFIHDETIETSRRLMFSHQVHFQKGSDDGTYLIYPRKGETWALFKDWNIGWISDPEIHRKFKYQMVEILSDFKQGRGVEICYLEKVKGFVSVFRRVSINRILTFLVPSSEMLRFSHSVPSTKLTGAEREGVPAGAFELDPASLPTDPNKLSQPGEMEWK